MRGGLISALLVLALYGSYHFNVIGFELTSNSPASGSRAPVVSGIASSKMAASTPIIEVPATKTPVAATSTRVPEGTATPAATATAVVTPTPAEEATEAADENQEADAELTALAPTPTATPEPEPTSTPTPVPTAALATPTPTSIPPTATVAVAVGVVITPASGATPAQTATPSSALRAAGPVAAGPIPANGKVTPYSDSLAGNTLGCNGYGGYDPADATTAAVSDDVNDVPCGTKLQLCSSTACLTVVRKDTCPGCAANHIDVSRRAFELLCGTVNECPVTIKKQ